MNFIDMGMNRLLGNEIGRLNLNLTGQEGRREGRFHCWGRWADVEPDVEPEVKRIPGFLHIGSAAANQHANQISERLLVLLSDLKLAIN